MDQIERACLEVEEIASSEMKFSEEVTYSGDCQYPQCLHLRTRFGGKGRLAARDESTPTRYDSLLFFSPKAFVFFLPGIALECVARLRAGDAHGENLGNALLDTLTDFSTKPRYREHLENILKEDLSLRHALIDLMGFIGQEVGFDSGSSFGTEWCKCLGDRS